MRFDKPTNDGVWRALHDEVGIEVRAPFATRGLWLKARVLPGPGRHRIRLTHERPPTFAATLAAYGTDESRWEAHLKVAKPPVKLVKKVKRAQTFSWGSSP